MTLNAYFEVDGRNTLDQTGSGVTKGWEKCRMLQKYLLGTFHGQTGSLGTGGSIMIGYPHSQARMG